MPPPGTGPLTMLDWTMLAGAIVALALGITIIARARSRSRSTGTPGPTRPRHSLPTTFACGFACLVLSYHLGAWALPMGRDLLQCPPGYWWALVLLLGALVAVSRGIDMLEDPQGE